MVLADSLNQGIGPALGKLGCPTPLGRFTVGEADAPAPHPTRSPRGPAAPCFDALRGCGQSPVAATVHRITRCSRCSRPISSAVTSSSAYALARFGCRVSVGQPQKRPLDQRADRHDRPVVSRRGQLHPPGHQERHPRRHLTGVLHDFVGAVSDDPRARLQRLLLLSAQPQCRCHHGAQRMLHSFGGRKVVVGVVEVEVFPSCGVPGPPQKCCLRGARVSG